MVGKVEKGKKILKYGKQEERRNRWMILDGVSGGESRRKKRMERGVEFSIDCLPLEIVREAFSLVIIVPSLYQN